MSARTPLLKPLALVIVAGGLDVPLGDPTVERRHL